jgi:hypothetical protein
MPESQEPFISDAGRRVKRQVAHTGSKAGAISCTFVVQSTSQGGSPVPTYGVYLFLGINARLQ